MTVVDKIVDALCVGDSVRWADYEGAAGKTDGARIISAVSDVPFRVGVRNPATGKKQVKRDVSFMRFDSSGKLLYLTGNDWVDRTVAEVVRVRSEAI